MKLLLDANLSWRITKPLAIHYPNSAHILDFFSHNSKDTAIWEFANKNEYTIVSNDEDFADILMAKGWPPKIVLLKTGNQSNNYLLNLLISKQTEISSFVQHEEIGILVMK